MKKNQDEPQQEGYSEPSEYKSYGDYYLLDSAQGSNLQFSDEDDDEQFYSPFIDFTGDQDPEE